jgi:hypothetical protein
MTEAPYIPHTIAARIALEGERVVTLNCQMMFGPTGPMPMEAAVHLTLSGLTTDILQSVQPTLIICPLFTADFDATTAIERLVELGYRGRVTILAPQLPNPRLVERELQGLGLAVTLITP